MFGFQDTVENVGDVFFGTQCRSLLYIKIVAYVKGQGHTRFLCFVCTIYWGYSRAVLSIEQGMTWWQSSWCCRCSWCRRTVRLPWTLCWSSVSSMICWSLSMNDCSTTAWHRTAVLSVCLSVCLNVCRRAPSCP